MNNKFVENSNVPNQKVGTIIISGEIPNIEDIEKKYSIKCITTKNCEDVYKQIAYHPDIQMIHLGGNNILVSPNTYNKYLENFKTLGINCIKGETVIKNTYPEDIKYNACIIGKYFVHNLKYTDTVLLEYAKKMKLICVDVKQGYTKCNISIIDEHSIITSDMGIAKELEKYLDVLLINTKGQIKLKNMEGFIGGSTGLISSDVWCINGDVNRLKDSDKIKDFLSKRNIQIQCLHSGEIEDIGSIIPIIYE